jgi:hypothetical protein
VFVLYRWLNISLKPAEFAEHIALSESFPFDLVIVNPAKTPNFIREWRCYMTRPTSRA